MFLTLNTFIGSTKSCLRTIYCSMRFQLLTESNKTQWVFYVNVSELFDVGCFLSHSVFSPLRRNDSSRSSFPRQKVLFYANSVQSELSSVLSWLAKKELKLSNNISKKHVFKKNWKMNVKIAVQTLSSNVADVPE